MKVARLRRWSLVAGASVVALGAVAYSSFLGYLYFQQERLIFPGRALAPDFAFHFDQRFEDVRIAVPGATLHALHFMQEHPRGLVFFLHGNAGNLQSWTTGLDFYRRVNYDLFMLDYRGYGKSTGAIQSEEQLNADVRAAWDTIAPRYRGKPIVVYGRSLGTGLAVKLAAEINPQLLVLVSPYSSLAAAAKEAYPIAPEWLLKYPLRTDQIIGTVKSPIMIVHGDQDRRIAVAHADRLARLTRSPTEMVVIEGAGHNDIQRFPAYADALASRLGSLRAD
ncbi:MAG: alpha/beta fold hydrolase [Betaproteobacteria bacterium]